MFVNFSPFMMVVPDFPKLVICLLFLTCQPARRTGKKNFNNFHAIKLCTSFPPTGDLSELGFVAITSRRETVGKHFMDKLKCGGKSENVRSDSREKKVCKSVINYKWNNC